MKFTKYIIAVLSTCLWYTASAIPAPVPNALSNPQSQPSPFNHLISSIPLDTHKNQGSTSATLPRPLARTRETLTNASSPSSNYTTLPGTCSCNNKTLTTYCRSNSSTFVNATVGGSPPAADCAAIADTLIPRLKTGFFFQYDAADRNRSGVKQLQRYGACAFGVVAGNMGADSVVRIGTGDVVSVIRESMRRFAGRSGNGNGNGTAMANTTRNGTVGRLDAAGAFICDGEGTMVNWALYHA